MEIAKRIYNKYSETDLEIALGEIKKGRSLRKVAKEFKIPKSTLHSKISGKVPEKCRKGPKPILNGAEENRIKLWILNNQKLGFFMNHVVVKDTVQQLLEKSLQKTIFNKNRPGEKWLRLFLKRYPELLPLKTKTLLTEANLRNWYENVNIFLIKNGLDSMLHKPKSIFNGDEIILSLPHGNESMQTKCKQNYPWNTNETIKAMCTFSAEGDVVQPMILCPDKKIPEYLDDVIADAYHIGQLDTKWTSSSTFYEYITNTFYPWCLDTGVEFPVIFFLDGQKFNLTLDLSEFCTQHNIIIYSLFPHSNEMTQPCNIIFKAIKAKWKKQILNAVRTDKQLMRKPCEPPAHIKPFSSLENVIVQDAFRLCGLYPFDANVVDYQKCKTVESKESNSTKPIVLCDSMDATIDDSIILSNDNLPLMANDCINEIGNQPTNLTYNDYLSTYKFFEHYLKEQKLQEFLKIRGKNLPSNDPLYNLWKICVTKLQNQCINFIDVNEPNIEINLGSFINDHELQMEDD